MSTSPRYLEPFRSDLATVHGVAAARLSGNTADATLVIQRHLEENVRAGMALSTAWATLFSAAVVALCDELEIRAVGEEVSPSTLLTEAAMKHALEAT